VAAVSATSTRRSSKDVFGYHWLPLSLYLLSYKTIGCALERYATPELQDRLLGPIARGELTFCQGFSRAWRGERSRIADDTARSDAATGGSSMATRSGRRAHGSPTGSTSPSVRTPTSRGIGASRFSSHRSRQPGIEVRRFPVLGGGYLCEVFLDGVEVPAENLVGEVDRGWDVLMHTLDFERITAEKLGGLAWVIDALEARLAETGRLDGAWNRLARLRGELAAARLLSLRAADLIGRGQPASSASAMAKLAGRASRSTSPGRGSSCSDWKDSADGHPSSPLEGRIGGLYRASVGSTISGGSAEILQVVIARRGLGLR
jgi:alkylation response protein AidB-like acyl-CoA dehydrogenase